jgi:transcription elongation factor GreA
MPDDLGAPDLIRAVGLMPDGPAVLGRPVRASGGGVYVIELATPLPRAPLDQVVLGKWIERLPGLRLDGERPTSKTLAARLAAFWVPSSPVVFVGSTDKSLGGRVQALDRHVLGDRQPHASSQWLKTLRIDGLRVWWANTSAPEEYEDALFAAFAARVPPEERALLYDQKVVLPFANHRTPSGERRTSGLTGAFVPDERLPAPPATTVVDLPPGDAFGVPEARNPGTTRRTNTTPPPAPGVRRPRAATPAGRSTATRAASTRAPSARAAAAQRPEAERLQLTPEGHARLVEEHRALTEDRRPEVIERIVRARELGDLKENADYTAAREEQSFLEGRVQALEAQLRNALIVEPVDTNRVTLGSHVTVELEGEQQTFIVVGPAESDPLSGRISSVSPVGRALLGKREGEDALVVTPRGDVRYRVVSIA